jgi:predicted nucleic-acid-binding Zn-ribbon protein
VENDQIDYPLEEVAKSASAIIDVGGLVFQKFSCSECGQRLMMDVPNIFYVEGACDKCGHVTDIRKAGCNYMVQFGLAT